MSTELLKRVEKSRATEPRYTENCQHLRLYQLEHTVTEKQH
jgi:hypothetical protein